jgi:prophage tail gpP-like protein
MSFKLKISDKTRSRDVTFFNEFQFELKYDSISSGFSLSFYFDPDNSEHKELANPSKFQEVKVYYSDELLMTGTILNLKFVHDSKTNLCVISGSSKTGVLGRSQIPTDLYPLQSKGISLRQIASKLLTRFNIEMIVDPSISDKMDKVYQSSTAQENQTVSGYLVEMARQKDIVITHDEFGRLLFTSANTAGAPLLNFDSSKEMFPGVSFELNFNGAGMHSDITVMKQASTTGGNAGQKSIKNPFVSESYYSPSTKTQNSGTDNDTILAVQRELASELKDITLTINTDRWIIDKKIIRPNNIISIIDPELYLYRKTSFFIESISYIGNNKETTAVLNCVIPEVYNGKIPTSIF